MEQLEELRVNALQELGGIDSTKELEAWRVHYLGKKSELTQILRGLGSLPAEERKVVGARAKGDMGRLWISRVNAASRAHGLTYGQFIHGLKKSGAEINRKMLADMAVREPGTFASLVTIAKGEVQDE